MINKNKAIFLFYIFMSFCTYSQSYENQNGTIIDHTVVDNINWEIRKHEQIVEIGDIPKEENRRLYSSYSKESQIITLIPKGTKITISKIARAVINNEYHSWLLVSLQNGYNGWLFFGKYSYEFAQFDDPYFDNRWEITGHISSSKTWTIRKMVYQHVAVWEVVNIRDKPGLKNTKVISKIQNPPNTNPQVNLLVLEATEEKEIIDDLNDRWLRISFNNVTGWIFGGYASVERGGPKYYTPESIISSQLGNYP